MITIISASNRAGNNTRKVAAAYQQLLEEKGETYQFLDLEEAPVFRRDNDFQDLENMYLKPADRYIIVMPEYNGSYPGVLKMLIDNSDVRSAWRHKKALLTGVSTGRAGNLRGMEHLTGSLMHMNMLVHPNRLPISRVDQVVNGKPGVQDAATLAVMRQQLEEFLAF